LEADQFFRTVRRDSHRGVEYAFNQTPDRFEQATPSYKIRVAKRRVTIDFYGFAVAWLMVSPWRGVGFRRGVAFRPHRGGVSYSVRGCT
jgi:hypothetical protein